MTLKGFKLTFSTAALEGGRVVLFSGNLGREVAVGGWGLVVGAVRGNGLEKENGEMCFKGGKKSRMEFP